MLAFSLPCYILGQKIIDRISRDNMISACSGTIVESELHEGSAEYMSTVLTSMSLFRSKGGSCCVPSNLKV